jgi:hypothetical protein
VLIFLYSCLFLTHINYLVAMHKIFNFFYKEIADPIIFVIHIVYRILYVDIFFYNIINFLKNITLHIKLKNPAHVGLQTSIKNL